MLTSLAPCRDVTADRSHAPVESASSGRWSQSGVRGEHGVCVSLSCSESVCTVNGSDSYIIKSWVTCLGVIDYPCVVGAVIVDNSINSIIHVKFVIF